MLYQLSYLVLGGKVDLALISCYQMFNDIKLEHVTDWHFQHIVDLRVSCSPKSSLLSLLLRSSYSPINFPFPSLNSTVPSLRVTCSLFPAPSCVPHSFQLLESLVLTVYCLPLSLPKS